jgi:transposase
MHLRKWRKRGKTGLEDYWALVESYRTERGPRQRIVAYLGDLGEATRAGVAHAAHACPARGGQAYQPGLFGEGEPEWVEVDARGVRVERVRDFGGPWLGLQLMEKLGLGAFLQSLMPSGREEIDWAVMAQVLILGRLCDPCSELSLAERVYERTALVDLLGVPVAKINDDRLYRALDKVLPHKAALERHLAQRMGALFDLEYDLLLYDVTSTYFEGECVRNAQALRGYSRDHRPDCKQVCIALIVSRDGMPLGYEVFAGNRTDVTTVEEIVERIEQQYGAAGRIWVMDRGMVSEENVVFLREQGRRYLLGTPKSQLRHFERELLEAGWERIREGLEVKLCPGPEGTETFILCRSAQRREKEAAMHERFEKRIEAGLEKISAGCAKRRHTPIAVAQRIGRLLGQNSRAAGCFKVEVTDTAGRAQVVWSKVDAWQEWASLSEGCYLLRSNITDWTASELWETYIQLTEAEAAFRIHKSDLAIRPIWHQKPERVQAHILVCFLAYVLWKTLGQLCERAGLGREPRTVLEEISRIRTVDVVLPTKQGIELRRRCVAEPTKHQAILLSHLGLTLPRSLNVHRM